MAAKYRFKTIMVTDSNRAEFSEFRDSAELKEFGRVTDKELFSALWVLADKEELAAHVRSLKQTQKNRKEQEKLEKLQKELEAKLAETQEAQENSEEEAEEVEALEEVA